MSWERVLAVALPEELADTLLESIVDGQFPVESVLPSEGELALKYGMSRLTVREAVRILRSQNIVTIRRGRGTFVNSPDAWTSLDAVVRIEERRSPSGRVSARLLEARRMVEVGAAQLAATNRSKEDLESLAASIEEMRLANRLNRVDLFVEADIAFHDVIMHATANMFIPFMFEPFGNLLVNARTETSVIPEIQVNAIAAHEEILRALTAGDPRWSRDAMEAHMNQTQADLRRYVLDADQP
jgi:GntR family transcriptional regulator, transcriptional repressor for pyruvate dehydrogenase complex